MVRLFSFSNFNYYFLTFTLRIAYFDAHYISKVQRWIKNPILDITNNLVERFNQHVKAVLFKGQTFNKGVKAIETLSDVFLIQEVQLLPEEIPLEVKYSLAQFSLFSLSNRKMLFSSPAFKKNLKSMKKKNLPREI